MTELEWINSKIQEDVARFSDDMARGHAKDFGAYQYACGIIRGLSMVSGYIAELDEQIRKSEGDI